MILNLLAVVLVVARLFPATPAGRALTRASCRIWDLAVSPRTFRVVIGSAVVAAAFALLASSLPLDLALFASVDLTAFLELTLFAAAALAALRLERFVGAISSGVQRLRLRALRTLRPPARPRAVRPPRRPSEPSDGSLDGDGGWMRLGAVPGLL